MDIKLYEVIKRLRIEHGYKSQQSFADALGVNLQNVKSWENAKKPVLPRLDYLLAMCDLFNCDLDYLTGRLDKPTHDISFIHKETGLSTASIRKLHSLFSRSENPEQGQIAIMLLSKIIEHNDFEYITQRIYQLIDKRSREELVMHLKRLSEEKRDNGKPYLKLTELEDIIPIFDEVLTIKDERSVESIIQYQISNKFLAMIDDILKGKVGGPYE